MKKHSKTGEPIGLFNQTSINAQQGRKVNEVEKFFMLCSRLIKEKMDAGEKGFVIDRGEDTQIKIKYENALRTCDRLSSYMGIKGAFSFGICKTCDRFDKRASATDTFGKCGNDLKHIYDTCDKHSKRGGGFGV